MDDLIKWTFILKSKSKSQNSHDNFEKLLTKAVLHVI